MRPTIAFLLAAIAAGFGCCALGSPVQAGIIVNDWNLTTLAANPARITRQQTVSLPFQTTDTVTNNEGATASTNYGFAVNGDAGRFEIAPSFQLDSDQTSQFLTVRSEGRLTFKVVGTQDLSYSLDGFFTATGDAAVFSLDVSLLEDGQGPFPNFLAVNSQDSRDVIDESFILGSPGGNNTNKFQGSLTGILEAGTKYNLFYNFTVQDRRNTLPVSAVGELNFQIGPASSPVPEPSTLAMFGIGVCVAAGGAARRRRREHR